MSDWYVYFVFRDPAVLKPLSFHAVSDLNIKNHFRTQDFSWGHQMLHTADIFLLFLH